MKEKLREGYKKYERKAKRIFVLYMFFIIIYGILGLGRDYTFATLFFPSLFFAIGLAIPIIFLCLLLDIILLKDDKDWK